MSDGVQGGNGELNTQDKSVHEVVERLASDIVDGIGHVVRDDAQAEAMPQTPKAALTAASDVDRVTAANTTEFSESKSDPTTFIETFIETSTPKIVDRRSDIDLANVAETHVLQPDSVEDVPQENHDAGRADSRRANSVSDCESDAANSEALRDPQETDKKRREAPKPRAVPDLRPDIFTTPTLFHFASSVGVTRVLERLVENALASNRPLDHVLLHGPPGCGTTLVARAMIRDLAPKNFVELDVLDGVDQDTLRRAIREVRNQGVLLIRHIELLSSGDEQFLMSCIARKTTRGTGTFARESGPVGPTNSRKKKSIEKISIDDFQIDGTSRRPAPSFPRIDGNFTLIATAHLTQQIGYQLRHRFDHMIHLRSDAVGVRTAIARVLTRHGFIVDESAHAPIERFTRTIDDVADQFVRAIVMRAELENTGWIDGTLVREVVTEDMPARIADEVYAWALTRHLAGRRVTAVTDNEVERLDTETGWGEIAVRAALGVVVRNAAARATPPAA